MLARRLERPAQAPRPRGPAGPSRPGAWRTRGQRPTRGPRGEVRWWERPAPGGDDALWAAVQRVQQRRIQLGVPVAELARRLSAGGWPITRETLSRILNGRQPTVWETVARMSDALGMDVSDE